MAVFAPMGRMGEKTMVPCDGPLRTGAMAGPATGAQIRCDHVIDVGRRV